MLDLYMESCERLFNFLTQPFNLSKEAGLMYYAFFSFVLCPALLIMLITWVAFDFSTALVTLVSIVGLAVSGLFIWLLLPVKKRK